MELNAISHFPDALGNEILIAFNVIGCKFERKHNVEVEMNRIHL